MRGYVGGRSPKTTIAGKILKYIGFDIILAALPLLVDSLICSVYDIKIENVYNYTVQICIMTIVLSASSIKGAVEGKILRKSPKIFWLILISNISIIGISALLYGITEYNILLDATETVYKEKPFILFVVLYVLSFLLGLLVQVGGGIDE